MIQVLSKEFNSFLNSLIAYIVIGVFLTGMGLLIWVFPDTSVLDYGYADLGTLFMLGPYVFMFLIPAITMKSFAEERKAGTMELLLTRPVTDWGIILGKFLACFLLVIVAVLPTLIYYFSVYSLGDPAGNIDSAGVMGSYIGFLLLGGVFCTVGILASVITPNQIVAFITAAFLSFLLYAGFDRLATINMWSEYSLLIKQLGILYHYESIGKGLVDSRDLVYFFSVGFLMLAATKVVLSSRSW
ncbi:MAG TPA: gliding motility-associated ABC transporter permease subunit GldF [Cyclobacteriaceae bacterium]|nr:gliding motility-associated ABC transporter permease subunit GldF [Cyclobacteriaceae bacterium]